MSAKPPSKPSRVQKANDFKSWDGKKTSFENGWGKSDDHKSLGGRPGRKDFFLDDMVVSLLSCTQKIGHLEFYLVDWCELNHHGLA